MSILFNSYFDFYKAFFTPTIVYALVFLFLWVLFIWDFYLSYRQYKICKTNLVVPKEIESFMNQETFEKARLYSIDKFLYDFAIKIWSHSLTNIILISYAIPFGWNLSGSIIKYFYGQTYEISQSLIFFFCSSIFFSIIGLPWSLYYTFVLEEKHGFNKYTLKFFLFDKLKKIVIFQAIFLPILALTIHIIKIGGDYFFFYLWIFCTVICLLLITIYPDFIAPLFDKYILLPECNLKDKISELAKSINYPLKRIFIVEGSKRSSHSNAYLYGLFKNKKVVLFDTLIDKSILDLSEQFKKKEVEKEENDESINKNKNEIVGCNEDEIIAILCHEFGHWKLNHITKNLIISEMNMLVILFLFGLLYQNDVIYSSFGFNHDKPIIIGLTIIFEYIFLPYNEIVTFLLTCLTRKFEFQADEFSKKQGKAKDLINSLIKLNKNNLSFPIYDWLYSACNHTHPQLLERIAALGKTE